MMAKKTEATNLETKNKEHFEAVRDFYKKKVKDVHIPRKLRKEIARFKTLEKQGNNE